MKMDGRTARIQALRAAVCALGGRGWGPADISAVSEAGPHPLRPGPLGRGGIPATDLDRVFDLAYRGDRARTPSDQARAGLGLAIARGFVHAQQGEIDVVNEGAGCRFTVRLPLA